MRSVFFPLNLRKGDTVEIEGRPVFKAKTRGLTIKSQERLMQFARTALSQGIIFTV